MRPWSRDHPGLEKCREVVAYLKGLDFDRIAEAAEIEVPEVRKLQQPIRHEQMRGSTKQQRRKEVAVVEAVVLPVPLETVVGHAQQQDEEAHRHEPIEPRCFPLWLAGRSFVRRWLLAPLPRPDLIHPQPLVVLPVVIPVLNPHHYLGWLLDVAS